MKGSRLIVQGCTGFDITDPNPEPTELKVVGFRHYRVICLNPEGETLYIPLRNFEVLNFPKDDER